LRGKFRSEFLPPPPNGDVKEGGIGETSHFLALNVNISKTVGDTTKVTINDYEVACAFDWHQDR